MGFAFSPNLKANVFEALRMASFFNGEVGNKITTPLEIKIENDGNINITDMEIFFSYKINNLEKKIKIQ